MLGTDRNYFLGSINYCFIWNEFYDNIGTVSNELYNKIMKCFVWIIWQKVLLGINYLMSLLSIAWNEFFDKIKYYYSKSSYHVKSLPYHFFVKTKILADFHTCIFVAFSCSLNCLHTCSIHYVIFTRMQWYMYS